MMHRNPHWLDDGSAPPYALLTPEFIAMVNRGVSTVVASRDAALRPSLMRAMGSCISVDGTRITVFLARSQVAPVAAGPGRHRTDRRGVQRPEQPPHPAGEGSAQSTLRNADEGDAPCCGATCVAMEREIGAIGYPTSRGRRHAGLPARRPGGDQLHAEPAFDQTPGPRAGSALPATA